ncbi:hypothetical protein HO173_001970 [Letharia columbiana]|uniref:Methylated-DNA--protein-cysteine methyltransferase n=1 Tax=Letharia columbiana TaxID=112416 RepID=A0A8H6L958_9LECA|nr:uncharacterized protein HO173_001970 [Letharia columbiana]KAF6240359.1 hypothetical protein HO173_001970 [Letharia columbiana]
MTSNLTSRWTTLYTRTLPTLAQSSQPTWPVHLDHCFARIILDAVIGNSTSSRPDETPTPWTAKLKSPAVKNMSPQQLEACIELGEAIAEGRIDLVELDQRSLTVRGKMLKGEKRKREDVPGDAAPDMKKSKKPSRSQQGDIRAAMGAPPTTPPKSPSPAAVDPALSSEITSHPTLTPFRRRVLLALCQVPSGSYTTYLALSNHLSSSPRAVGNALRNNPFAPRVPCHRVVAADGGMGGFGGEWGPKGKHNGKKVRLLKGEGVKVDAAGGRVMGSPWSGFK